MIDHLKNYGQLPVQNLEELQEMTGKNQLLTEHNDRLTGVNKELSEENQDLSQRLTVNTETNAKE